MKRLNGDYFDRLPRVLRSKTVWLGVASVTLAGLAAFSARGYLEHTLAVEKQKLLPAESSIEVIVAARDLRAGEVVGTQTVAARRLPKELVPGGNIRTEDFGSVEGKRLGFPLRAGEPLIESALQAAADRRTLATRVRAGARAMSIPVDETAAVSGLLQPGDSVDLLLTLASKSADPRQPLSRTLPILQNVKVLATGQQFRALPEDAPSSSRGYSTITVEVLPVQAQHLVVAMAAGRLTAVLRNPNDEKSQPPLAVDQAIFAPEWAPPVLAQAPVEVLIGGKFERVGGALDQGAQKVSTEPGPSERAP